MKWLIGLLIAATGLLHLLFGLGIGLFGGSNLNWMLVLNGAGYLVLLFLFWTATGSRRNTIRWILLAYTLITLVGYFLINGAGAWQFTFGLIIKGIELLLAILLLLYRGRDEVTVAATTAAPAASRSGAGVTSTAYQSAAGASSVSTAGPIGAAAVADMVSSEVDATVDAPHVGDRAVADIDAGLDSAAADVGAWGEPTTANIDMGMGAGVGTVRLDAAEPDYMVEDVVAEDVVAEGVVVEGVVVEDVVAEGDMVVEGDVVEEAAVVVEDAVETDSWLDRTGERVGDAVDSAGDAVGGAVAATGAALGAAGAWLGDKLDDAGEAAGEAMGDAGDWIGDRVEDVGEAAGEAVDATGEAMSDAGDWVGDRVEDVGEAAAGTVGAVAGAFDTEERAATAEPTAAQLRSELEEYLRSFGSGSEFRKGVEYIEGIGPAYGAKLRGAGVVSVLDLMVEGATRIGRKHLSERSGISASQILTWVNHVDLFRIKGVAEEYADLLEQSGVDTVVELAQRNPNNLFKRMIDINEQKKLVRRTPHLSDVQSWVEQAKGLKRLIHY